MQPQPTGAEAPATPLRVVGYVSTLNKPEQQAQFRATITDHCQTHGFELVKVIEDNNHTKTFEARAGFQEALDMLDTGQADALAVAELGQVALRVKDVLSVCATHFERFTLISVDEDIHYPERPGSLMMTLMMSVIDSAGTGSIANPSVRSRRVTPKPPAEKPKPFILQLIEKEKHESEAPARMARGEQITQENIRRGQQRLIDEAPLIDERIRNAPTPDELVQQHREHLAEWSRQQEQRSKNG